MPNKPAALQIDKISVCKLIDALHGGGSFQELQTETGLCYHTVSYWTRVFKHYGFVYISAYERDSRGHASIRVWKWCGPGAVGVKDRQKPARKTSTELTRAMRERKRRNILYFHDAPRKEQ